MSDLLVIDGAISAGTGESVGAVVCRPTTAVRSASWWSLPMAGAVLLHFALLALALLAQDLGGKPEPRLEVYPIRLYSAAEAVMPGAAEPSAPITPPLRRSSVVAPPAIPPSASIQGLVPPAPVGPGTGEMMSAPVAPTMVSALAPAPSVGNGGPAVASGNRPAFPVEAAESLAVAAPMGSGGERVATSPAAALPELVAHPLYRLNREPEYPPLARRRQQEGTVVLEVLVTPEGTVGGLALQQSSGHSLLDEAALKGVKGWRFEPGRRGAVAVTMKVLVPVRFGLR